MTMWKTSVEILTEEYPWAIKVPPRIEFSPTANPNKYLKSLEFSGLAFKFGFMEHISHDWSICIDNFQTTLDIGMAEDDAFSLHLRDLLLELISRDETNFKIKLICTYNGYKEVGDSKRKTYSARSFQLATNDWNDSIDTFRITFTLCKQTIPVSKPFQDSLRFKDVLCFDYLSDATVVCGGKEFKVHRLLLASQSQVFDAMFRADMAESKSGRTKITDFEPEVVEQLLKYMYTRENPKDSEIFEGAMGVFRVAHKYEVTGLKDYCESLLLKNVTLGNAFEMCELAELYSIDRLKSHAFDVIKRNKKELFENATKYQQIAAKFPNIVFELFNSLH